jgi:protein AaeX
VIRELDLFGVFVSPMAALIFTAALVWFVLRRLGDLAEVDRRVWRPPLFHLASFVLILSGLVLVVFRWIPSGHPP